MLITSPPQTAAGDRGLDVLRAHVDLLHPQPEGGAVARGTSGGDPTPQEHRGEATHTTPRQEEVPCHAAWWVGCWLMF